MKVRHERGTAPARRLVTDTSFDLTLHCAQNVYAASDRRTPEGRALVIWLGQTASTLGLDEAAVPDDEAFHQARRASVSLHDWQKVGGALQEAAARLPRRSSAPLINWLLKIAGTLALDSLETEILALALTYRKRCSGPTFRVCG